MPLIDYVPKKFGAASMAVIDRANRILAEYAESGYDLAEYGGSSWELDALPPDVLTDMIREKIRSLRDEEPVPAV